MVLPAHAGMIPLHMENLAYGVGAPRACGDDPMPTFRAFKLVMCSPRMRG